MGKGFCIFFSYCFVDVGSRRSENILVWYRLGDEFLVEIIVIFFRVFLISSRGLDCLEK